MKNHEFYLEKCLNLACKGFPNTRPNPMVGSVIVYKDKIIGEGYHEKYGANHAEVNAINSVKDKSFLPKSTIYVNLEPCSHFGKTPPCADLIIKNKIPKVVIGCVDTFSKVSGNGIQKMRNAGIEVVTGVLITESRDLNKRFFTFHEKKRPYIILKWAESKDGFIAPLDQKKPFWMTTKESKKLVHNWRSEEDSILIGRVTAEKDNPLLTVRKINGKNPTRIVIDRNLKLSKNLNLFNSQSDTIIFNEKLSNKLTNVNYIKINFKDLTNNILSVLYELSIQSLIIEGGTKTLQSFIDKKLWDEARIFYTNIELSEGVYSPKIEGEKISSKKINEDLLEFIVPK